MAGGLDYPWTTPPAADEMREVAPGLHWIRLPLPFRLNHVNVWALEEPDGWTVIDTGCDTSTIRAIWEAHFAGGLRGRPVRRVVATHGHVDHIGLSGWIAGRHGAAFVSTLTEWLWARLVHEPAVAGSEEAHRDYLVANGFSPDETARQLEGRRGFLDLAVPLPGAVDELRHGATIRMGGRDWEIIVSGGHAFAHAAFHDPRSGLLIAGDQLLPEISPVVAIYETTPRSDLLADFLGSFPAFAHVASDTLVLPSHGMPYRGIHERIVALRQHHVERLDQTLGLFSEPRTAREVAALMFPRVHDVDGIGFAVGEVLAHVNHLVARGRMRRLSGSDGVDRYVA
ncbi:MBL fold metallo-hydrolase [Alsobacter sp. R-9]